MPDQAEANYSWFKQCLPALLAAKRGQHALLHNKHVEDYFASSLEAVKVGLSRFGEGNFSVEPVDDSIEDLGFYSHVGSALRA
jgi:hypothetical protein